MSQLSSSTLHPKSLRMFPHSHLLPLRSSKPETEELLLAMEESRFEAKLNEIRKHNSNLLVIGKVSSDHDREHYNDLDDGDEVSEDEEFGQETG